MGVIQNAMNQLLGTASIAARLSPSYETKQKLYESKQNMKRYKKQAAAIQSKTGVITQEEATIAEKLGTNIVEESAKRFELDPTSENLAKHEQNVKAAQQQKQEYGKALSSPQGETWVTPADPDEIRIEQANLKAAQKSAVKQKAKRNFKDYLKNIEIQGGGKVGDLPPQLQEKIAAQYSKEKRKSIMDSMDKEKK